MPSYPSTAHNDGSLTETEYESFASKGYAFDGWIGTTDDPAPVFGDTSGMQVKFRANTYAAVRGQQWVEASSVTKSVAANSSGSTRVDLLTLRLDRSTNTVAPHVVTGTPGSGAPAPTQNAPGSGVWDFPVGTVTVVNGAATINSADVTFNGWYITPSGVMEPSTSPAPHTPGQIRMHKAAGRAYIDTDSSGGVGLLWEDSGEVGGVTAGAGWTVNTGRVRRISGIVYTQLVFTRTGAALPPSTLSVMGIIPATFRPIRPAGIRFSAYQASGQIVQGSVESDGTVNARSYFAAAITTGQEVQVPDLAFPCI